MLPAPTFENILERASHFGERRPTNDRLVSVVFSDPNSLVIADLQQNQTLWDELTGDAWDLFFAGYFAYGGDYYDPDFVEIDRNPERNGAWRFSPRAFTSLLTEIEGSIRESGGEEWRYSGGSDLVNFMVYGREPDWLSVNSVDLVDGRGIKGGQSVGQVIEGLRRWQTEEPDRRLAPGGGPYGDFVPVASLADALRWAASAAAAGVLGSRVDAILDSLL